MDRNRDISNDRGVIRNDDSTTTGGEIGQAVGGVSGVVAGAAIGSAAGPIGTVIGGLAGAVGGWWAGKNVGEAAQRFDDHADNNYRQAYEARPDRLADRT
jgi:phage tail tape-measure protein